MVASISRPLSFNRPLLQPGLGSLLDLGLTAGEDGGGGGFDPVLPSRYWRLAFPGFYSSYINIREIEFAATPGGADLCSGGTPSQIGSFGTVANAFDNNTSTETFTITPATLHSIQYLFASDVLPTEVRITGTSTTNECPRVVVVQVSYDSGTTWRSVEIFVLNDWTSVQTRTLTLPSTLLPVADRDYARGWRVRSTLKGDGTSTGYAGVAEMILADTPGGSNIIVHGTTSGSYMNSCYSANEGTVRLSNGSTAAPYAFSIAGGNAPYIIGAFFATPTQPVQLRMVAPGGSENNLAPGSFTIEWSSDGATWNVSDTYNSQTWTASQSKSFTISP